MTYLLNGGDPIRDGVNGIFHGSDLALADLDAIDGLSLDKHTTGLPSAVGAARVKSLSTSHWTPEIAELAQSLPNLEHLLIFGIKGVLAGVGQLPHLKILSIYASSGLVDFEPFEKCVGVETLWISSCIHLQSLGGIDRMRNLKEFEIQGSMTKTGTIPTLSPLSRCEELQYVSLATKINDKDLSELFNLSQLRYLWLQNRFKHDQYTAILASCPMLKAIELHDGVFDRLAGYVKDDD